VLEWVGLSQAGRYPVRGFSLGMRQRLGLATALIGNPRVLLLDEPANGLDPEGIVWLRGLLRHFADVDGRTVLISSHVLSEVEQTVDRVVIIAKGRLIYEGRLDDLEGASAGVVVRTPTPDALGVALAQLHATVTSRPDGSVAVGGAGVTAEGVGHAAWEAHVEIHELRTGSSSLEETFLRLTADTPDAPRPEA
jgi:ABC-2 type transport system ATP-binding protein